MLSILTVSLLVASLAAAYPSNGDGRLTRKWDVGRLVDTTSGKIQGHPSEWRPDVSEYLAVPYAAPPLGSLRFAAPQPEIYSDDVIDATAWGPACLANIVYQSGEPRYDTPSHALLDNVDQVGETFAEDCLTLNIWTKPQTGEAKKAVMMWIYGGGFNSGSPRNPGYNGAWLADTHDVIVVSMNYRGNIFGFPGADFLEDLNLGLLDQRRSIEWVRDNIESFGGDPTRITLFGQSSGAQSVDHYTMGYVDRDPIVHAFIAESGYASDRQSVENATMGKAWYDASEKLGCGGRDAGNATLDCMRTLEPQTILDALTKRGLSAEDTGFGPTPDGKLIFNDVVARRANGTFVKKPLLIGSTGNEGAFWQLRASTLGLPTAGLNDTILLRCGPPPIAKSRVVQGVPAWRYVYNGQFPNEDIGFPGAWHGSEVGLVFNTTERWLGQPNTAEENNLTMYISTAWTTFAKDPYRGLSGLGWPIFDENEPTAIRMGGANSSEVLFEMPGLFTVGCPTAAF